MSASLREVSLSKGTHTWVFRYPAGHEAALLRHLLDLAARPATGLDEYDAAMIASQVRRRPTAQLETAR